MSAGAGKVLKSNKRGIYIIASSKSNVCKWQKHQFHTLEEWSKYALENISLE